MSFTTRACPLLTIHRACTHFHSLVLGYSEHRRAAADPSLHPAAAYRADRHAASRLWGRRMRLLLLWKLAAAALWTTAVAGLCLCLWLGLTAQNIASVIVWLVFVVSLGYIDLSTVTPFAALFATQAAPSSAIASTCEYCPPSHRPASHCSIITH